MFPHNFIRSKIAHQAKLDGIINFDAIGGLKFAATVMYEDNRSLSALKSTVVTGSPLLTIQSMTS